jgi:hypothetical protein
MLATLILSLAFDGLTPPPTRAEVCYAQIEAFIADEMNTTGRVAGPSWFIRDWWAHKLAEGLESDTARQAAVAEWLARRQASEPEVVRAEKIGCIEEAIAAGALP